MTKSEQDLLPPAERPRFLSETECHDILQRIARVGKGGGHASIGIWSTWTGNVRWVRNQISTSGEIRNDYIRVERNLNGAHSSTILINDTSEAGLIAAVRRAEREAQLEKENPMASLIARFEEEPLPAPMPSLFVEATYKLDAAQRAQAVHHLVQSAVAAGMHSAGYLEVGAHSIAVMDTLGHARYLPYTTAQYSVTVRDPQGTGSGWAGVDWPDWTKIDAEHLSALALEKCLSSRHPVTVEPGRYTTILEPQAVCQFVRGMLTSEALWVSHNNMLGDGPFQTKVPSWAARKGERVVDERLTISADPTDPELGFPPFNPWYTVDGEAAMQLDYEVYHPTVWIEHGVLRAMGYPRSIAISRFGENLGSPIAGAFRMSGGTTSVAEMIATTKRGLLVTRFWGMDMLDGSTLMQRGYTRDGLWLIEDGKISKPVKNMVFTESIVFALNNIEQLGVPQRAFSPLENSIRAIPLPVIVPPLKIRDFSFTSLSDAV